MMEEEIGALLQSAPQVVKRVLRGLSCRQLKRAAQYVPSSPPPSQSTIFRVCRMWRTFSAIVIKERRRILSITMAKRNRQSQQHQPVAQNFVQELIAMAKINRRSEQEPPIVEDKAVNKRFLLELDMECGLAIVFRGVVEHRFRFPEVSLPFAVDSGAMTRHVDGADFTALRRYLTPSTVVFGATCSSGIVGTSIDGSSRERQDPETDCLSAFLIPKSLPDGVVIKHFAFPLADRWELGTAAQNTISFAQTFGWPESETVKCMIFVTEESGTSRVIYAKLISCIQAVYDGKLALAGGIANEVRSTDNDEEQNSAIVGLLFGGENVRAASLVIGQQDSTRDDVRKRLMELKATVSTWGNCKQKLGFMFTCCGRGKELHGATDVETGIFKELMPDVLLNGMFSFGEFGWDFLTPSPVEQPAKDELKQNEILFVKTTTIAVVGFV